MKIAVLGAKTRLGVQVIDNLHLIGVSKNDIVALDTQENAGLRVSFGEDDNIVVHDFLTFDFSNNGVSYIINLLQETFLPQLQNLANTLDTTIVHYNNSMANNLSVPLMVNNINTDFITNKPNIIASPCANAITIANVLNTLGYSFNISNVNVVANYSVSEIGNNALDELFNQTKSIFTNQSLQDYKEVFNKQIAFNFLPKFGNFTQNGCTDTEENLTLQISKILQQNIDIAVSISTYAVFIGNTMHITLAFNNQVTLDEVKNILQENPIFSIVDYNVNQSYATPVETVDEDKIYLTKFKHANNANLHTITFVAMFDNLSVSSSNIIKIISN